MAWDPDAPDGEWGDEHLLEENDDSLSLRTLLAEGYESATSRSGLEVFLALLVPSFLGTIVTQSLQQRNVEFIRETTDDPAILDLADALGPFPLAFDLPPLVLLVGLIVTAMTAEAVWIVAVRAFAARELDGIPRQLATRRLGTATLLAFVGGVLLWIGTAIGLGLFLVPGIVLAVFTLFFRQEIAVADKSLGGALSGTWKLTKGNRWELFGLWIVLLLLGAMLLLIGAIISPTDASAVVITTLMASVGTVFSTAVVTAAYTRLHNARAEATEQAH